MNATAVDCGHCQEEEETEISDEALEAAASAPGRPLPASSLSFSSYHLLCC
ncbi:MAG TPA: hypothetical protein VHY10_15205 [Xanthobacteraceae bacterium]|jgi:hypothetical protein|nr:hypothetical protein [Xanthobacteraceae bacterium]